MNELEGVRFLQHVEEELRLEDGGGLGRVRGQGHEAAVLVAGAEDEASEYYRLRYCCGPLNFS